jgi:hypothetical protein
MPQPWPLIVARYEEKIATKWVDETFNQPLNAIRNIAGEIERSWLGNTLYGWTSMHDLCIQQTDHKPYSRPYLRISPLLSGELDFRFVDTPVATRQWHRVVPPGDAMTTFSNFLDAVRWIEVARPGTTSETN